MTRAHPPTRRLVWAAPAALLIATGCLEVRYVAQAAGGELGLLRDARPISKVLGDDKIPPKVRALLAEVGQIKRFAQVQGLRATSNYRRYVERPGDAVVWVVSACGSLSFRCKSWGFPLVGEFPYLGWFDRRAADAFATELEAQHLDVDVRGASAFSTLGWFGDPLISTMLATGGADAGLGELANVVIHESVHATLHIPSEAHFNESLASFVADALTVVYLQRTRGEQSDELRAYSKLVERRKTVEDRFHETYAALERLYASTLPAEDKLAKKAAILKQLSAGLKVERPLNNATLAQYRTYGTGFSEFQRLFEACDSNWRRFMSSVGSLNTHSFAKKDQQDLQPVLGPLLIAKCPAPPL